MAVTGRRGVGRTTVAHALASRGFALTSPANADVNVHVLADAVKPEDHAAIEAAGRPLLAVLNKADLLATTAPGRHPDGPTSAARARCAQLSARAGVPIEPLIGILAGPMLDDASWQGLRAMAGGQSVDAALRSRLMATLDAFGIRQASAAIRRGVGRGYVDALLRGLSGIDAVVDKIGALGAPARYQRMLDAVAELETMTVTDQRISEFLTDDDTVVARMMAAVEAVEAVGIPVDRDDTAAAHLRRAKHWQGLRRGPVGGTERACDADIVRGSLRLWSRVGGSV
ncbi:hypothetical protein [Mycobacterium sp.]|uniref:hypothetical protein n=1 Tax=Mycobacterium sp. TaxID=1785 RepID=UPI003D0CE529